MSWTVSSLGMLMEQVTLAKKKDDGLPVVDSNG